MRQVFSIFVPWIPTLVLACVLIAVGLAAIVVATAPALARWESAVRLAMKGCQGLIALFVLYDVITLLQGHQADEGMTHAGYAIAAVGVPVLLLTRHTPPADPDDPDAEVVVDPPHLFVVAVAAFAAAVLVIRLQQTW